MSQEEAEELAPRISLNNLEWTHAGLILGRGPAGSFDAAAVADPCISFDEKLMRWRLFYTGRDENGREVCAQVLSKRPDLIGPGEWLIEERSPLVLTNPEALRGQNWSQPCPVFDPLRSSYEPALIDGNYWLFFTAWVPDEQAIYAAHSPSLSGPWTILDDPIKTAYTTSPVLFTPIANWFSSKRELLLYSTTAAFLSVLAWELDKDGTWRPLEIDGHLNGLILRPSKGWNYGSLQGLQLLPGQEHHWYGLINISEPASPVAGFIYSDNEEWPITIKHWKFMDEPIERVEDIPEEARAWGEGERLGRHSMLVLPGGGLRLFYESGPKGQEQIYLKRARQQTA